MKPTHLATSTNACLRAAVIAPTYNNADTLITVLDRVLDCRLPVIVIDDGSTDGTRGALASWYARLECMDHVRIIRHTRNRGKAAALRRGFDAAAAAGCSHVVTIDTDGQHHPEEIPKLLAEAARDPVALILGRRADRIKGCPARSRLGRRLSNLAIRLESGVRVRDSQSGMRVYPLDFVQAHRNCAGGFAYESEILTRAGWSGVPVREVLIRSRYLPRATRVSHFQPWRDSFRCLRAHLRLMVTALQQSRHGPFRSIRVPGPLR